MACRAPSFFREEDENTMKKAACPRGKERDQEIGAEELSATILRECQGVVIMRKFSTFGAQRLLSFAASRPVRAPVPDQIGRPSFCE
jgi:hypothetical protein